MVRSSNKYLLIIVAFVVVVAAFVLLKPNGVKHESMEDIPTSKSVTGDTTADTLATVTAEVEEVERSNQEIIEFNQSLTRERQQNNRDVESIKKQQSGISQSIRTLNAEKQQAKLKLDAQAREIDQLKKLVSQIEASRDEEEANGLPIGFGFDANDVTPIAYNTGSWVSALDAVDEDDGSGIGLLSKKRNSEPQLEEPRSVTKKERKIRVLTLAENATGFDSVALTTMVGRIPVKGTIPDPYPFKLIMGKENIVANGMELPEVQGMIWSGVARGDWNLKCVAGELFSVTFVFEDGTIVTQKADDGDEALAWISDDKGFPCVDGEFVTNAPAFLAQRTGLAALSVAAEAYSEAQRTTRSTLLGSESFISGDTGKYVLGESVDAAADEVSAWLLERQQQSFDAVVAKAGIPVGVHLNTHIEIDYELDGRKLRHEDSVVSAYSHLP